MGQFRIQSEALSCHLLRLIGRKEEPNESRLAIARLFARLYTDRTDASSQSSLVRLARAEVRKILLLKIASSGVGYNGTEAGGAGRKRRGELDRCSVSALCVDSDALTLSPLSPYFLALSPLSLSIYCINCAIVIVCRFFLSEEIHFTHLACCVDLHGPFTP